MVLSLLYTEYNLTSFSCAPYFVFRGCFNKINNTCSLLGQHLARNKNRDRKGAANKGIVLAQDAGAISICSEYCICDKNSYKVNIYIYMGKLLSLSYTRISGQWCVAIHKEFTAFSR